MSSFTNAIFGKKKTILVLISPALKKKQSNKSYNNLSVTQSH